MVTQLLAFIRDNCDKIKTDVASRFQLEFKVFLNEIDLIEFPAEKNKKISYRILDMDGDVLDVNTVDEYKKKYRDRSDFTNPSQFINVFLSIDKELFECPRYSNFCVFNTIETFLISVDHVKIENPDDKLVVLLLNDNQIFESDFIKIINVENFNDEFPTSINHNALSFFNSLNRLFKEKTLNNYLDYPLTWINGDYFIEGFAERSLRLFLSIVCNRIIDKNIFLIRGYKTVYIDINSSDGLSEEASLVVGKLTTFLIDEQRSKDKLLIIRNTMTLFLRSDEDTKGLNKSLSEIEVNVEYNFNTYIQDKIKLFFEQKNKIYLEYINTTRKIEDLTNSMISQFRTVALSLLGTIFLSLLSSVNGAKTVPLISLVLVSYLAYFVINFFLIWKQNVQIYAILKSLKQYTNSVRTDDEEMSYDNLKKKYLDESINLFEIYRKGIMSLLIILIVIFILLFVSNRTDTFPFPKQIFKFIIGY